MGIGLMTKKGIGKKLLLSYGVLIALIFLITGFLFSFISRAYVTSEVKKQLEDEASKIGSLVQKTLKNNEQALADNLTLRKNLRVAGSLIESHLIVTNPANNQKIVFTNLEAEEKLEYVSLYKNGLLDETNIVYSTEFTLEDQRRFQVTLFTKMKDFKPLNQMMRRALLLSLLIAGAISCVLAVVFEKRIMYPIKKLEQSMKSYDPNRKNMIAVIESGDEIEALSRNYIAMVEKIEQYDQLQKSLLQNTSHELKTPIMSIQGYAEGILDGVLIGDEANEALEVIISESKRLKKTIDEVLYLSKLDNQHVTLKKSFVAVDDLLNSAVKAIKPIANEKKINLVLELEESMEETILVDGEKILRAIINLLGNAVRYAHHEILVSVVKGQLLSITVSDDGDGFSEEDLLHASERFYKGNKGGTGLGLTITKAIVEAHGGTLKISNQSRGGAEVTIMLKV